VYLKGEEKMLGEKRGRKLDKYMPDYVVFDLETTGTNSNSDSVIEISAVKVKKGRVEDEFSTLVNPECPIPFYASQVNNIYDSMVKDAPVFKDALAKFNEFIGGMVLVGHNIHTFDMKFIWRDAESYWGKTITNDYIDTLTLARQCLWHLSHYKLVDLASHYHISADGAHRALADCRMNQKVFEMLGKELESPAVKANTRTCPKCGQFLKKRSGKFGEFWGCSGYPACRYTENI
jgi:DNA polymerase-3 subunit epsilon